MILCVGSPVSRSLGPPSMNKVVINIDVPPILFLTSGRLPYVLGSRRHKNRVKALSLLPKPVIKKALTLSAQAAYGPSVKCIYIWGSSVTMLGPANKQSLKLTKSLCAFAEQSKTMRISEIISLLCGEEEDGMMLLIVQSSSPFYESSLNLLLHHIFIVFRENRIIS